MLMRVNQKKATIWEGAPMRSKIRKPKIKKPKQQKSKQSQPHYK